MVALSQPAPCVLFSGSLQGHLLQNPSPLLHGSPEARPTPALSGAGLARPLARCCVAPTARRL